MRGFPVKIMTEKKWMLCKSGVCCSQIARLVTSLISALCVQRKVIYPKSLRDESRGETAWTSRC
jgi:hypothetical protein